MGACVRDRAGLGAELGSDMLGAGLGMRMGSAGLGLRSQPSSRG